MEPKVELTLAALQNLLDAMNHCRGCSDCSELGCDKCTDCTADAAVKEVEQQAGITTNDTWA